MGSGSFLYLSLSSLSSPLLAFWDRVSWPVQLWLARARSFCVNAIWLFSYKYVLPAQHKREEDFFSLVILFIINFKGI